jgi:hypothetical protein
MLLEGGRIGAFIWRMPAKWSPVPASFLNLTYAIRNPLNGLAYAKPSKVFTFATSLENLTL